ncbi:hypothetical protein [Immundisolibacter sp.]
MSKVLVQTYFKKDLMPQLKKRLEIAGSQSFVTIGVHEKEGSSNKKNSDGQLKVIDVATFHEFGTTTIPERSFIRANDKENFQKYKNMIREIKDKIIFENMTIKQGLGLLGEQIRADIQAKIRSGIAPELEESTIRRKGSSIPLIDTGQLINSIIYKIGGGK